MFGQSNHPREGVESVHSLPILLPLLKTELVCGNRLSTTAQAVQESQPHSHILHLIKIPGAHHVWKQTNIQ